MRILQIAILLLPFNCFCQKITLPYNDGRLIYEQIDTINGKSQAALYLIAKQWVADNFKSAKDIIQFDDKESGTIMGKFYFQTGSVFPFDNFGSFSIDCRDNKFRFKIYDFNFYISGHPEEKKQVEAAIQYQITHGVDYLDSKVWGELNDRSTSLLASIRNYFKAKLKDNF